MTDEESDVVRISNDIMHDVLVNHIVLVAITSAMFRSDRPGLPNSIVCAFCLFS